MASAEEIRARVKRADEQRADAAARVGELLDEREELLGKLAELGKTLGGAVGSALKVMSGGELAEFTGRAARDIDQWTGGGKAGGRVPRRATRSSRSGGDTRRRHETPANAGAGGSKTGPVSLGKLADADASTSSAIDAAASTGEPPASAS